MKKEKWKHHKLTGLKASAHERITIMADSELSFPVKSMYLYICEVSSWGNGLFTKDRVTIQKELNMPKSTVQKYLRVLSDKEYILRVSCYHEYAFTNPNHFAFIFPLKYHDKLFYQEDIDKIRKNALSECDKIESFAKVEMNRIRNLINK